MNENMMHFAQHQPLTKFQSILEIKSHQLRHVSILAVWGKLFNFALTFSNLNFSFYVSNPRTCQCKESEYSYEPHGHVITGDVRVIENAKLKELVAKRPKYRKSHRVNWKATKRCFFLIH